MRQREEGHVTEAWTLRRGLQAAKEVAEDAAEEAAQALAAREEAEKREKRVKKVVEKKVQKSLKATQSSHSLWCRETQWSLQVFLLSIYVFRYWFC